MEINARAEKEKREKARVKNIRRAKRDFFELLGSKNFRQSDFYDCASMHGIESDDLLNALI